MCVAAEAVEYLSIVGPQIGNLSVSLCLMVSKSPADLTILDLFLAFAICKKINKQARFRLCPYMLLNWPTQPKQQLIEPTLRNKLY